MKTRVDTKWYSNGQKKSEYNYKVGFCIFFTPFLKISFNVKEEGLETDWYKNGQKREETTYQDGKANGLNTGWYENGQKEWEVTWKDGKEISEQEWNDDGSLKN